MHSSGYVLLQPNLITPEFCKEHPRQTDRPVPVLRLQAECAQLLRQPVHPRERRHRLPHHPHPMRPEQHTYVVRSSPARQHPFRNTCSPHERDGRQRQRRSARNPPDLLPCPNWMGCAEGSTTGSGVCSSTCGWGDAMGSHCCCCQRGATGLLPSLRGSGIGLGGCDASCDAHRDSGGLTGRCTASNDRTLAPIGGVSGRSNE